MTPMSATGRTYNELHVPRAYSAGHRRFSVYWTWSYPWEANRDVTELDNRFSTMTEVRRVAWPAYESETYSDRMFLRGIDGTLELSHLSLVNFQTAVGEATDQPVAVYQRVDQAGQRLPIDERILADTDTLMVFGLDHLITDQEAEPEEIAAIAKFLDRDGTCLILGPHHDVGASDDMKQRDVEYHHHGDALVPRQQRFTKYTRSLMKGLVVPVENRWGLRPATVDGTRKTLPLSIAGDLDSRVWLEGVQTFVFHMHLPHYAVTTDDPKAIRVLARQQMDMSRPHPFSDAGNREFTCFCGCRPPETAPATFCLPIRRSLRRSSAATKASSVSGRTWRRNNMATLELDDIQSGVLRPRPTPFHATYIIVRIDDPSAGRELMRRLSTVVSSAAHPESPAGDTRVSASLTFAGLKALRVPQSSLESFSPQFQQGMAARAHLLGDVGESAPEHWEKPLGSPDVHVVVTAIAKEPAQLESALGRARAALAEVPGIVPTWRQDCHVLPDETEPFGFKDGISHPAIEGSGIPGTNPHEVPLKAGEFVLGYPDEICDAPIHPQPAVLGRNGSYVAFRKLHQRVAKFRRYLKAAATSAEDEELVAAKMMGRWRSGAPLALCATDDPAVGADPKLNNSFLFKADDSIGYKTPLGSHIRRMNPRDAQVAGVPRIHRMIRRGTAYGPPLLEGVLEDDGVDRGLMFAFVGANLGRQFEFVQTEWMNNSTFFGGAAERDPISGSGDGTGSYSIPRRPLRRVLSGLPRFVVTRGGEYGFLPSLSALQWLADLETYGV
jgi:Dyp-type peroxidase family